MFSSFYTEIIIVLGKALLEFVDLIFGESVFTTLRDIAAFVVDGVIVGIIAFHPHSKANPAVVEQDTEQVWQKESRQIDVQLCIDRLWVAPHYRRNGMISL